LRLDPTNEATAFARNGSSIRARYNTAKTKWGGKEIPYAQFATYTRWIVADNQGPW
jgi:hypothetical protein